MNLRLLLLKIIRKFLLSRRFATREFDEIGNILKKTGITAIYDDGQEVYLPVDNVIFPRVLAREYSEGALPNEIVNSMNQNRCVFIDVGAHVGVAARDIVDQLKPLYCYLYEPDQLCFKLLGCNSYMLNKNYDVDVFLNNRALGVEEGFEILFRDSMNTANNSLLQSSIPRDDRHSNVVDSVEVVNIHDESLEWAKSELPIFYMSDAQGMDEALFVAISPQVLNKIAAGKIEIFSITNKEFDQEEFLLRISGFSRLWIKNGDLIQGITYQECEEKLMDVWSKKDRTCFDILFLK